MAKRQDHTLRYELAPGRFGRRLSQQDFIHGHFDWLHYPDDATSDGILVARVTIGPGDESPDHHHGGYEQMLYVLSGRGVHWVDGEKAELLPGRAYFLPMGVTHRIVNTGDEPFVHLSVYHPRKPEEVREIAEAMQAMEQARAESRQLDVPLSDLVQVSTLQQIQDKFAAAVGLGVVTITRDGEPLTRPTGLPDFCQCIRSSEKRRPMCRAFDPDTGVSAHKRGRPLLFNCCSGIVCVAVPLLMGSELVGHMACGFIKLDEPSQLQLARVQQKARSLGLDPEQLERHYLDIEVVLHAHMVAAAESLQVIANSIVALSAREMRRRIESEYAAELLEQLRLVNQLERELKESEFRVLEAKINPHFLFNALNTIASATFEQGDTAADIVYALSDFLRFSLRHNKPTVRLDEEVQCLENYLRIQQARFGDGLNTIVRVEPGLEDVSIPFMVLQPLVENAIVHGLAYRGYRGRLAVAIRQREGRLRVDVADSGVGFEDDVLVDLHAIAQDSGNSDVRRGVGLRYVRTKLHHTFGDDYELIVRSISDCGTCVTITMPIERVRSN